MSDLMICLTVLVSIALVFGFIFLAMYVFGKMQIKHEYRIKLLDLEIEKLKREDRRFHRS